MPLPEGTKYRYKPGTKIRLAFLKGKVVEAKHMESGKTHTREEFAEDEKRKKKRGKMHAAMMR